MRRRSLSFKLLLSYLLVVAIAAVAAFGVARWLGPRLFDTEVRQIGQRIGWVDGTPGNAGQWADNGQGQSEDERGRGQGPAGTTGATTTPTAVGPGTGLESQQAAIEDELADAFTGSLTVAMLVALGVGLVAGFLAATVISRRLLRPLDRMRSAVRRMAAGDPTERVAVPPDRELADLATDVNALASTLAETEERRTRLVSDLSHELRTPITAIDGFLEGLEDGVFEPDAETLSAMRTETRRLERLASDLSALSRAAEGAFDLDMRPTDLVEVAEAAARALSGAALSKQVTIDTHDLEQVPVVDADPDRMAQVFTNLIRNAIQHAPSGGLVVVGSELFDHDVVVSVSDTGPGIPQSDLERVFDRFVRLGGDVSGGAGLGLTIARGIVRAHGGELVARNAAEVGGHGTVFIVTIPAI